MIVQQNAGEPGHDNEDLIRLIFAASAFDFFFSYKL